MTQRLDVALVRRGLARSRGQAQDAVRAGDVRVDGRLAVKASQPVGEAAHIERTVIDPYVSRAANKLAAALDDTDLAVPRRVLDAGASTGGFTQVLLERGAERVYAVDVGHGQLVDALRGDPRVVVHEGVNLRDLTLDQVGGEPVDLVVADVSFISLRLLLAPMLAVLSPEGSALVLVKPQFEVGRAGLDSRGVVKDPVAAQGCVDDVVAAAAGLGFEQAWRGASRTVGASGNQEWFVLLRHRPDTVRAAR